MTAELPIRAAITGVHGYLPDYVLDNAELAAMVNTSDAWITERTGIKERHILKGEGLGTSHMAAEAVRGLLAKTATKPADVDLLICATTTPDLVLPSTADLISDMVGILNIGSFDIQAARSGVLCALPIPTTVPPRPRAPTAACTSRFAGLAPGNAAASGKGTACCTSSSTRP